jgi:hypothetical protein
MSEESMNRREFTKSVATGAAGASLGVAAAENQTVQAADDNNEKSLTEADHLLAVLQAQYPMEHLSDEELRSIRAMIGSKLAAGRFLQGQGLSNADAPDYVFAAYRGDEQKPTLK